MKMFVFASALLMSLSVFAAPEKNVPDIGIKYPVSILCEIHPELCSPIYYSTLNNYQIEEHVAIMDEFAECLTYSTDNRSPVTDEIIVDCTAPVKSLLGNSGRETPLTVGSLPSFIGTRSLTDEHIAAREREANSERGRERDRRAREFWRDHGCSMACGGAAAGIGTAIGGGAGAVAGGFAGGACGAICDR